MAETEDQTPVQTQPPVQAGAVIAPSAAQQPIAAPSQPSPLPVQQQSPHNPISPYALQPEAEEPEDNNYDPDDEVISWTASEFVAHQKTAGWYGILTLIIAVAAGVIFLLTKDAISTGVVILVGVAFGVYAARQPRQLPYQLDSSGVTIGEKHYSYEAFRYFSVVPEGAFSSIVFMPLKRFAPLTTIYYAPQDEDRIIDLLTPILPLEDKKRDPVDRLMERIRF